MLGENINNFAVGERVETRFPHVDLRPALFSGIVLSVDGSDVLIRPDFPVREAYNSGHAHFYYDKQLSLYSGRLVHSVGERAPSFSELEKRLEVRTKR